MRRAGRALGGAVAVVRRVALVAVLVAIFAGIGDRDAPKTTTLPELDVIVVLDRTTSMSALDAVDGSRMDAAEADLVALSDRLESARFTVITVGRAAEIVLPATSDRVAFQDVVRWVATEPADAGTGSSADRAVPLVERLLRNPDGGRPPVLVYAGDGEDTVPASKSRYADLREQVTAALVLGYGTDTGGFMPLVLSGSATPARGELQSFVPDPRTGEPAVSRADPERLAAIAEQLDGTYVAEGGADMAAVAAELERTAYATLDPVLPARQLGWAWAVVLLVLTLPELRRGWRAWLAARQETTR